MKLYTTKKIKDTHHMLSFNKKVFEELTQLNPNLYFCIYTLLPPITKQHGFKKVYLNYAQTVILSDKFNKESKTSAQALADAGNIDSNTHFIMYQMLMDGFNLSVLLNRDITLELVKSSVNQLNQWYVELCKGIDNRKQSNCVFIHLEKKTKQSKSRIFSLTDEGMEILRTVPFQLVYLFKEMFVKKMGCYAQVEWNDNSIAFFDELLVNFDITQLTEEQKWKFDVLEKSLLAFTPQEHNQEFYIWLLITDILYQNK